MMFSCGIGKLLRTPGRYCHSLPVRAPKFPYGECYFRDLMVPGKYFIDKTSYIRTLEETGKYLKIWRPRRFGKSTICNMLSLYYDAINSQEEVNFLTIIYFSR